MIYEDETPDAGMLERMQAWMGWGGEVAARDAWNRVLDMAARGMFPNLYEEFPMVVGGTAEKVVAMWDACRKVLGKDTPNYAQQIGDCVGFGGKNAEEYLQCQEIVAGDREVFKLIYVPYNYGASHKMANYWGMGSTGAGMAAAAMQMGVLPAETPGLPNSGEYSGGMSSSFGRFPGPDDKWVQIAKRNTVKSAARITNEEQFCNALQNRYPVTIASNYGYTMTAGSDGFHMPRGSWAHQMCVVYVNLEHSRPHVGILNSWGDVHGRLKDLTTGEDWPVGVLRVDLKYAMRHVQNGEAFAFSQFDGFPAKKPDYSVA